MKMRRPPNSIVFQNADIRSASGNCIIATEAGQLQFQVIPANSPHPKAPTHRIFRMNSRGFHEEIGGIWYRSTKERGSWTLTIRDPDIKANLAPISDDPSGQTWAVLKWNAPAAPTS